MDALFGGVIGMLVGMAAFSELYPKIEPSILAGGISGTPLSRSSSTSRAGRSSAHGPPDDRNPVGTKFSWLMKPSAPGGSFGPVRFFNPGRYCQLAGICIILWGGRDHPLPLSQGRKGDALSRVTRARREGLRHCFGSYLLLGLEFLIAADIINTVLKPVLGEVAVLAAIVLIRTIIGLTLDREFPPGEGWANSPRRLRNDRDIALVFGVLLSAIILFSSEKLRVDVVAVLIMVALLDGPPQHKRGLFRHGKQCGPFDHGGHGHGRRVGGNRPDEPGCPPYREVAGADERRLIALVSSFVGSISAFMQNIGAVALVLPALLGISRKTGIPSSRLLMPMGFSAILGGTLTMVASGPLIILTIFFARGAWPPWAFSASPRSAPPSCKRNSLFPDSGKSCCRGDRVRRDRENRAASSKLGTSQEGSKAPGHGPVAPYRQNPRGKRVVAAI